MEQRENAHSIHTVQQPQAQKSNPIKFRAFTSIHPKSTNNPIHKSSLQTRNLTLKSINLLPAVQRPPIIQLQASSNLRPRLRNAIIQLRKLPPSLKLTPQLLDLRSYRIARGIALSGLCGGHGCGLGRRREGGDGIVVAAGEGDAGSVQVQ
jgi:hypothetical protein